MMATCELIQGDCLDVLRGLDTASVDAVVTDPPYLIAAQSVEGSKYGFADLYNAGFWYAAWLRECWRVLKTTGHLMMFGNWRSLPTYLCAMGQAGIHASSCLVWDKQWIGAGHRKAFRPTWELILHAAREDALIADRKRSDLFRCKWMARHSGKTGHKAEKPAELCADLIRYACPPGGTILDPFAGSGTTGVAALMESRSAILIEREPAYVEIARQRLAALEEVPT